jgi:hypothetical protein
MSVKRRLSPLIPGIAFCRAAIKTSPTLTFDLQFVQLEEFLHDGFGRFFHFRVGAEENRFALVQEYDPIGQLLSQPHVVGNDDAGET